MLQWTKWTIQEGCRAQGFAERGENVLTRPSGFEDLSSPGKLNNDISSNIDS